MGLELWSQKDVARLLAAVQEAMTSSISMVAQGNPAVADAYQRGVADALRSIGVALGANPSPCPTEPKCLCSTRSVQEEETEASTRTVHAAHNDLAALRVLLLNAFTAKDLQRFCHDRTLFRPLLEHCSPNASHQELSDVVLQFCGTRALFPELLREIRECRPRQYTRWSREHEPP